jgi:hypothetical protein
VTLVMTEAVDEEQHAVNGVALDQVHASNAQPGPPLTKWNELSDLYERLPRRSGASTTCSLNVQVGAEPLARWAPCFAKRWRAGSMRRFPEQGGSEERPHDRQHFSGP